MPEVTTKLERNQKSKKNVEENALMNTLHGLSLNEHICQKCVAKNKDLKLDSEPPHIMEVPKPKLFSNFYRKYIDHLPARSWMEHFPPYYKNYKQYLCHNCQMKGVCTFCKEDSFTETSLPLGLETCERSISSVPNLYQTGYNFNPKYMVSDNSITLKNKEDESLYIKVKCKQNFEIACNAWK